MERDAENIFRHHRLTADQTVRIQAAREKAKELDTLLDRICPAGPERSCAHFKLEEAMFWANASIARNGGKR